MLTVKIAVRNLPDAKLLNQLVIGDAKHRFFTNDQMAGLRGENVTFAEFYEILALGQTFRQHILDTITVRGESPTLGVVEVVITRPIIIGLDED